MTQRNLLQATFDAATELKDAGSVSASGAATVGGAPRVLNLGAGLVRGSLIVDVDALDFTTGDETAEVRIQGSSTPDFSADVAVIQRMALGDTSVSLGESVDQSGLGRRSMGFTNRAPSGVIYPYVRAYHVLAGTTPSINYRAFITKDVLA